MLLFHERILPKKKRNHSSIKKKIHHPWLRLLPTAYLQFPVPPARMIKPLFNVFRRNDTHTRLLCSWKNIFLGFSQWTMKPKHTRRNYCRETASQGRSLLLLPSWETDHFSLSLSLENRWTFTYLTYTFVSTSFWSVENNACSQPLLFPLVSGITSRRMRTRVACNTTVITRKRIVSRGSNGIVRVASQKLDLPRFHASCDPLKRESNLSKTYISFSLVY